MAVIDDEKYWDVHCPYDREETTEDKTDWPKEEAVLPKPNRQDTDDSGSDIELGELEVDSASMRWS